MAAERLGQQSREPVVFEFERSSDTEDYFVVILRVGWNAPQAFICTSPGGKLVGEACRPQHSKAVKRRVLWFGKLARSRLEWQQGQTASGR